MTDADLQWEVQRLQAAIRKHRDERGDDKCWLDDEELYRVLPEGFTPPARDVAVELANCRRYIATRHNPGTVYVSPQVRIAELERENRNLQVVSVLSPDGRTETYMTPQARIEQLEAEVQRLSTWLHAAVTDGVVINLADEEHRIIHGDPESPRPQGLIDARGN